MSGSIVVWTVEGEDEGTAEVRYIIIPYTHPEAPMTVGADELAVSDIDPNIRMLTPAVGAHPLNRALRPSEDHCPNCGESQQLAKIKGCVRCLKCHWKEDCWGW